MDEIAHWTIPLRFGIDFGKMGLSTILSLPVTEYLWCISVANSLNDQFLKTKNKNKKKSPLINCTRTLPVHIF